MTDFNVDTQEKVQTTIQGSELNWVRLPLQKAHNVRELGGYPVKNGGQTTYHRFLRADDLSTLTDEDVQFLLAYGVSMVLDLRSDGEAQRSPDRIGEKDGINYARIPFLGRDLTDATKINAEDVTLGLGALYVRMIENKEVTKEIFEAIEKAPSGCILFHCSAGKDRTGVLAMLLMSLVGVDKQDCMSNYEQSYVNLTRNVALVQQMDKQVSLEMYKPFLESQPETIGECYDKLMEQYGDTESYLLSCGLSEEQIAKIKSRLLS